MPKIYVNARFLTQPMTGVQRFASEICKRLKGYSPDIIFVSPPKILQKELARELEVLSIGKFKGHLWEQLELPFFLRRKGSPLLVNLANTGPLMYNNAIVTIHDLSFFFFPKAYNWKFRFLYQSLIPLITKRAIKIITVSEGSRKQLADYLEIESAKIKVVYNSASHFEVNNLNSDLGIKDNYILTVASFNPIKNLPFLIKAFERIADRHVKLVIVGAPQSAFNKLDLKSEKINERILFLGYVNDTRKLISLYSKARAFVFPSLYESFGIPNIEAMTCGCPVITSRAGSIPEICGDAALFVDPKDEDDLTRKIDLLLSNQTLKEDLVRKGFIRSKFFNWDNSAHALYKIISSQ